MVVMRIQGGLGNQMFQYAAGYALAKRLNQPLVLDTTFYQGQTLRGYNLDSLCIEFGDVLETGNNSGKLDILKNKYINKALKILNVDTIPYKKDETYLLETGSDMIPAYFSVKSSGVYVDGYYQSERYFAEYRNDLLRQFRPDYSAEQEYADRLCEIETCNSVAVHVRRGDFLKLKDNRNPKQYLLGELYYQRALKYAREQIENPQFFCFSDDIEWVKENFGEQADVHFISLKTSHSDIDEMMLMKNCHHIINANSTFSWWASWLNEHEDAIRICPARSYGNTEMIPDDWVKIEVE